MDRFPKTGAACPSEAYTSALLLFLFTAELMRLCISLFREGGR